MISEGQFPARSEHCQIYKKKGYYSKDRENEIIFDISIEIRFPGQSTLFMLVLIECKNYNHRVPVDDVEEFFAKVEQVSPSNTKSIVVSTNAFQEGTFKFAKSKGMALLRYFDPEEHDWVLTRSPSITAPWNIANSSFSNTYKGLHLQDYVSRYFDFYGFIGGTYMNSLNQFFNEIVQLDSDRKVAELLEGLRCETQSNTYLVSYRETEEIESLSQDILKKVNYVDGAAPLDEICESLAIGLGLEVRRTANLAKGVLGTISFNPPIIQIDDVQAGGEPRIRFTVAHELGHFILGHQRYMTKEKCHKQDIEPESAEDICIKDIARMEWQANYFASCLLLPSEQLLMSFRSELTKRAVVDRGYGLLYLDDQPCNVDAYYAVTTPIMNKFNVSRSAIKIRLKHLGLLSENTSLRRLKTTSTFWSVGDS
ncbi:hypothetical protein [Methylomonas fluvii]|nr:ImmA/IrrE family metallo-endopeptidase [Methylomonas fluvii]CAD6872354.1 hypothetical protein [Methylomonas fluvii]